MEPVSAGELNRATLARQLLLEREARTVADAVRQVVALQAQFPPSPYLALWNRVADLDPADVDAAFVERRIVKSNVPRMTLHAVVADEHRAFREATEPSIRAARLHDERFRASGMRPEDVDEIVPHLLAFVAEPRTAPECEAWLRARLGDDVHPGTWWALRQYAPWLRLPTGGPWSFSAGTAYVEPPALPRLDPESASESLPFLVRRYLHGFGPASVADMALFAMVQRGRARRAVDQLGDELEQLAGPGGEVLYDLPGAPRPPATTVAPARLLGMWDNVLLAHVDRSRVIPPEHRKLVIRRNGDVLPTLLVDGHVAGVWRAVDGWIEAVAFEPISDGSWEELEGEARALLALLADREPHPYARYHHWWQQLPTGVTRVLARATG